MSDELMVC